MAVQRRVVVATFTLALLPLLPCGVAAGVRATGPRLPGDSTLSDSHPRTKSSAPDRPSSWQLGAGGAGTLLGSGWSAALTYERVVDPVRSLVARGEFIRVLDRGTKIEIQISIPEWQIADTTRFVSPDAWANAFALCVGGRYVRPGRSVRAYIESSFGPAIERVRGSTRASALVAVSGGALLQPRRSPVGGFAELRMGLLVSESGIMVTGRAGLLFQRP